MKTPSPILQITLFTVPSSKPQYIKVYGLQLDSYLTVVVLPTLAAASHECEDDDRERIRAGVSDDTFTARMPTSTLS